MRNSTEGIIIIVGGAALISAISAVGRHENFGITFAYVTVGLVVIAATMAARIMTFAEIGKRRGGATSYAAAGFLVGLFIVAPITATLAYRVLRVILR